MITYMKTLIQMKYFLHALILSAVVSFGTEAKDNVYSIRDITSTVYVQGIEKPLKVMHITDAHISLVLPSDPQLASYAKGIYRSHSKARHFQTGETVCPAEMFKELLGLAVAEKADLIVLTGDIVNYPEKASVEFVYKELEKTGIPFIYIAGNHDWHYAGIPGERQAIRKEWTERILKPLYQGANPLYSSTVINNMNFVAIDNSIGAKVNDEQLEFFIRQKNRNLPMVLLMHLAINPENMRDNALNDAKQDIESPEKTDRPVPDDISTAKFYREILDMEDIIILSGHFHNKDQVDMINGMVQFITMPGERRAYRIFNFIPLDK